MLKRLYVKNFTVFSEANFEFGPGLNVVVGTNGTGKSHVLKLGYAVLNYSERRLNELRNSAAHSQQERISGSFDFIELEEKLKRLFRPSPNDLSKLIRRNALEKSASIGFDLDEDVSGNVNFHRGGSDGSSFEDLSLDKLLRIGLKTAPPIFIPAKEPLTLGWMLAASRQFKVPMDEAYLDLLAQLGGLSLQKPEPAAVAAIAALIQVLGGEVEEQNGSFFLVYPKEERMEMNLIAEGLRKFGTLQKLLANGSLTPKATLFWDEPEANLNPVLLKKLAAVLAELARQGFQIILATHSLFLLKELHILSRQQDTKPLPVRYFGLNVGPDEATTVTTKDDFELLPDIVALDEELEQADALEDIFASEDRSTHAAD